MEDASPVRTTNTSSTLVNAMSLALTSSSVASHAMHPDVVWVVPLPVKSILYDPAVIELDALIVIISIGN